MATLKIVNGPSKWDLMISLFHGGREFDSELVMFEVETEKGKTEKMFLSVTSLQREPYDNTHWNFEGLRIVHKRCGGPFPKSEWSSHQFDSMAKGSFSTQTREGYLELAESQPIQR